ncbi:MAG: glycosyltransferase family 4 protein [Steroidobacteraceae bacterium]
MSRLKLAIIATHPVQYTVPVLRVMAQYGWLELKVFYTWSQTQNGYFIDREFGTQVSWDIPLLNGYEHEFVANTASDPGPHHFNGICTPKLCKVITTWGADAVLIIGWNNQAHLKAMRYFKGRIPVFFRGDSTLLDDQPRWRVYLRRLALRRVYKYVDVAISVGRASRDYFYFCGLPHSRIAFAPHCVDNHRFADGQPASDHQARLWRQQFGIADDQIVIGFAGKLIEKKDPALLINAFIDSGVSAYLVICGSGNLESSLRSLAAQRNDIHFLPFQNQSLMPAVYRLFDVFVLPSRGPGETWGLAINEAMACGRAVIASTKAGATTDLVNSEFNGWQFPAQDRQSLSNVLTAAVAMGKQGLQQLGNNGLQTIQQWSTEVSAKKIADTVLSYSSLLADDQDVALNV